MSKKRARFIINPTSGTRNKDQLQNQIDKQFSQTDLDWEITFTEGPFHATNLALEAANRSFDWVIAVGGDGTVNEVATGLMHTNSALGIIPIGSGNGLARHLGIPMQPLSAIESLLHSKTMKMDVCTANGQPFFNVAGAGYDAVVAHDFAQRPSRGFRTYVQTVLDQWFKYRVRKFKIHNENGSFKKRALMISVANGSQFGNNAYIAPLAEIDDGLMDICILEKFPASAIPMVAYQLFNKAIHHSRYTEHFRTNEFRIKQKSKKLHLDGEPYKLGKKIEFKVLPKALNILAPKDFRDEFSAKHSID